MVEGKRLWIRTYRSSHCVYVALGVEGEGEMGHWRAKFRHELPARQCPQKFVASCQGLFSVFALRALTLTPSPSL